MQRKIANEKEILQFYTRLLRMEGGEKSSDALKAAEFFVKYLGMLDKQSASKNSYRKWSGIIA